MAGPTKATAPAAPTPTPPVPSLGRVVHYSPEWVNAKGRYAGPARAAIVGDVEDEGEGIVSLIVFNKHGGHWIEDVPHADEPTAGHWNWPPRV